MTARKNPHLNSRGEPKRPFSTAAYGYAAIEQIVATGTVAEDVLHAYPCTVCSSYHIGQRPRRAPHRRGRRGAW